jgi:hypothetical protein
MLCVRLAILRLTIQGTKNEPTHARNDRMVLQVTVRFHDGFLARSSPQLGQLSESRLRKTFFLFLSFRS